jgi:hypothetical protein
MLSNITIDIESKFDIGVCYVEDLNGNSHKIKNRHIFSIPNNWFLLKIPYENINNEIFKIKINNVDIDYLIYTGFFENLKKEKFQPATAVWEPGEFKIWLHPNAGFYKYSIFDQIQNGDYGKNLFEKYMLTVDRSVNLDRTKYPDDICDFFQYPFGPKWWLKNDITRPYKILENKNFESVNKDILIKQIKDIAKVHDVKNNSWEGFSLKEKSDLPFESIFNFPSEIKKIIDIVEYTDILDISLMILQPRSSIKIHVDDHLNRDGWKYLSGCRKLYWTLTDTKEVYFKFGRAGLLPLDSPALINTGMHVHSVVNNTDEVRYTLLMYGKIQDHATFKNLRLND